LVSTFLTLIYVPIFYDLFDGIRQRGRKWLERRRKEGMKGAGSPGT